MIERIAAAASLCEQCTAAASKIFDALNDRIIHDRQVSRIARLCRGRESRDSCGIGTSRFYDWDGIESSPGRRGG